MHTFIPLLLGIVTRFSPSHHFTLVWQSVQQTLQIMNLGIMYAANTACYSLCMTDMCVIEFSTEQSVIERNLKVL